MSSMAKQELLASLQDRYQTLPRSRRAGSSRRDRRSQEGVYGEDETVATSAGATDQGFTDLVNNLIGRLTAKASHRYGCPNP